MIRIEQAIARAKDEGRAIMKKDIAAHLWPDAPETTQVVNMTNLCSGKTKRVEPEWIAIICKMTGVSADFLVGLSNE